MFVLCVAYNIPFLRYKMEREASYCIEIGEKKHYKGGKVQEVSPCTEIMYRIEPKHRKIWLFLLVFLGGCMFWTVRGLVMGQGALEYQVVSLVMVTAMSANLLFQCIFPKKY